MFRSMTVSVPIVATAVVTVVADDEDHAIELACHIIAEKDEKVVMPYFNIPVLIDFEPDRDGAVAMPEEERTR